MTKRILPIYRHGWIAAVGFALILLTAAAVAADPRGQLTKGESVSVAAVVDGDTVELAAPLDGAREIRLVGVQAPKLPLGRKNFPTWPLASQAKTALETLALNKTLTLYYGESRRDRHGRILAHLIDGSGVWIQGALLRDGMARVYTFPDNRAVADLMYAEEKAARAAKIGIWRHPFYRIRTPDEANKDIGSFQLVEGRILEAARVKGRVYLNFGADWRTDFTVAIGPQAAKTFRTAGFDPLTLKGATVRVRGWLKRENGPMIELSHPEPLEILEKY